MESESSRRRRNVGVVGGGVVMCILILMGLGYYIFYRFRYMNFMVG